MNGASQERRPPRIAGPVELLVLDIDNTLFDWFRFWTESFAAMLDAVVSKSGVGRSQLLKEVKSVHERHGTSEYAFVLDELPSLWELGEARRRDAIAAGIAAYRAARELTLHLYPGVLDSLIAIRSQGVAISAFTESQRFYATQRIKKFGLDGLLDRAYFIEDHDIPQAVDLKTLRSKPPHAYELEHTSYTILPRGTRKPDPKILRRILSDHKVVVPALAAYVGDNAERDIHMAKAAGVIDVYAQYGTPLRADNYELLRAVSHWTSEEIHGADLAARNVNPTVVLKSEFSEILERLAFRAHRV